MPSRSVFRSAPVRLRLLLLALISVCGVYAFFARETADAPEVETVRVESGCLPWDGNEITLHFPGRDAAGRQLQVSLWGRGLEGQVPYGVVLPAQSMPYPDIKQAGLAQRCASDEQRAICSAVPVKVVITRLDVLRIEGRLIEDGASVRPFAGFVEFGGMCG